ncbi:hypothetical protein ACLB2K_025090 [Fragaria x ananassa]
MEVGEIESDENDDIIDALGLVIGNQADDDAVARDVVLHVIHGFHFVDLDLSNEIVEALDQLKNNECLLRYVT